MMAHPTQAVTPPVTASPSQPPLEDEDGGEDNIFRDMTFEEVLEDLNARFLVNLPEEEMSLVRVYWQAEQAHWFYEDYLRPLNPLLPSLGQRHFTHLIIASSPLYEDTEIDYDAVWEEYCAYKKMVPCCGGILINKTADKVLMVRGWKSNAGWCFPRGKINSEESEVSCAIREVEEETGFDLTGLINENDFIKTQVNAQDITMFIVAGIDESTVFETQTRKEIGAIEWVPFSDLPTWTHKKGPKRTGGKGQKRFYNVTPFVGPLKKWLSKHGYNPHPPRRREKPAGRELQPFAFDDTPSQSAPHHPTTALDHLFAKFIEGDQTAVALESDNAKNLDRLFGSLEVSDSHPPPPPHHQHSEDDALTQLLSGIGHVSAPPVHAQPTQPPLPEKQNKLLSVLNQKPAAAQPSATPPRSTHQTNLLSMLASPTKVSQQDPALSSSYQGDMFSNFSSSAPPPHSVGSPQRPPDDDRLSRQRALLEASFGGVGELSTPPPPRAVSAASMMSPMPPLPPAEAGWYGQQESALHGPPGTPGYQRLPPGTPTRGGYPPQNVPQQLRQTAQLHNAQRFPQPPPPHMPQVMNQPPPQQPSQPPSDHQRALLGALFNGPQRPLPPHMSQQQSAPSQAPHVGYQKPPPPPFGQPSMNGGSPYSTQGQQAYPIPDYGSHINYAPQYPQQPPDMHHPMNAYMSNPPPPPGPYSNSNAGFNAPPQQRQLQQQHNGPQPNLAPPNPPSPSVHQPVPRPPIGGGLLGLMSR